MHLAILFCKSVLIVLGTLVSWKEVNHSSSVKSLAKTTQVSKCKVVQTFKDIMGMYCLVFPDLLHSEVKETLHVANFHKLDYQG